MMSFSLWLNDLISYLKFKNVIVFSWMSVSLIFIPIIFYFPIYWFFADSIYDKKIALEKTTKIMPYFKVAIISSITLCLCISVGFTLTLKEKGYVICKGIPSGWTPGTATKYAKDISHCSVKDKSSN